MNKFVYCDLVLASNV